MSSIAHARPTDDDIADIFDAHRLICDARNYPDVPQRFDDLPPGTQATIRQAAELRAYERNMQRAPHGAGVVVIGRKADPTAPGRNLRTTRAGKTEQRTA